MWPPVREQTSIRRARMSSASRCSSSRLIARRSAGDFTRSRIVMLISGLDSKASETSGLSLDDEPGQRIQFQRQQTRRAEGRAALANERIGALGSAVDTEERRIRAL